MKLSGAPSTQSTIDQVCGLPITRMSEWADVRLGNDYRVNLCLIGNQIIVSQPWGHIQLPGIKAFLDLIDKIVNEAVPAGQSFVIVEDLLNLRRISLEARRHFINRLQNYPRIAGLVFFNTSPILQISIKLGKRLYKGDRVIRLANSYSQAVEYAVDILAQKGCEPKASAVTTSDEPQATDKTRAPNDIIANKDWALKYDGFTTQINVIGQHILHSVSTGLLKPEHVEPIAKLRETIQKSIMPKGNIEYIVADVGELKGGNRAARKLYIDSLKQWHHSYPLKMYIMYGANRVTKAASYLAGPFLPFKIRVVDTLEEALEVVDHDQHRRNSGKPVSKPPPETSTAGQIDQYVTELLEYLGHIDWEANGVVHHRPLEVSHPFLPVFESIALVKGELDELIQERNAAEKALRTINDSLEAKVRERTAAIQKANTELKAEIAERERTAEALKDAKLTAERANRAKSEFLANMSHELRTPLNHIIGFTELILSQHFGELNDSQQDYLADIRHSGKHLLSLINDILDLSKVEAEKADLKLTQVDLPATLEDSAAMFKLKARKHAIRLSLDARDAPQTITVDERKLKQILYNLLSNAVKFTPPKGTIAVTARRCSLGDGPMPPMGEASSGGVCISVSDTGIGIRPHDLERIFKPFEQVDNSAGRKFQGTGLGLSLIQKLVALHGGKTWVESPGEGKGTTFHIVLPLRSSAS